MFNLHDGAYFNQSIIIIIIINIREGKKHTQNITKSYITNHLFIYCCCQTSASNWQIENDLNPFHYNFWWDDVDEFGMVICEPVYSTRVWKGTVNVLRLESGLRGLRWKKLCEHELDSVSVRSTYTSRHFMWFILNDRN